MAYKDGSKSGGRRAGTRNKRTVERERMAQEAAAQMIKMRGGTIFEGDSHAFLMSVYQNEAMPIELRADAAKAALRHEKPILDENKPYLVITDKDLEQIDFPDGPPRFLVRMPTPIATLDEWRERHTKPAETTPPIIEAESSAEESKTPDGGSNEQE